MVSLVSEQKSSEFRISLTISACKNEYENAERNQRQAKTAWDDL